MSAASCLVARVRPRAVPGRRCLWVHAGGPVPQVVGFKKERVPPVSTPGFHRGSTRVPTGFHLPWPFAWRLLGACLACPEVDHRPVHYKHSGAAVSSPRDCIMDPSPVHLKLSGTAVFFFYPQQTAPTHPCDVLPHGLTTKSRQKTQGKKRGERARR